jgi:hypothetical protein
MGTLHEGGWAACSSLKSTLDALSATSYFPPNMKFVALQVEVLVVVVTDDAAWACRD